MFCLWKLNILGAGRTAANCWIAGEPLTSGEDSFRCPIHLKHPRALCLLCPAHLHPSSSRDTRTRILCFSQIPISSCCRLFLSVIKISHYFSIWVYGTLHKSIMPCRTAQSNNETQGMEANFALLHHCYGGWYQTPTSHRAMCLWSPLTFLMCFPNCHFQKVTKVTRITLMLF